MEHTFTWEEIHYLMVAMHDYCATYGDVGQVTQHCLEKLEEIEGAMWTEQEVVVMIVKEWPSPARGVGGKEGKRTYE